MKIIPQPTYTIGDRLRRELRMADDHEKWRAAMLRQYSNDLWDSAMSELASRRVWLLDNLKPTEVQDALAITRQQLPGIAARLYADLHTVGNDDEGLCFLYGLAVMDLVRIGNNNLAQYTFKKQRESQITPGEQPQPDLTELLAALEDALR